MQLHIIRHAEPDYVNKTITPVGHKEAEALSVKLKKQGLDRIYCSPLGRARHTMQYTADALGMEPTIEEWTRELSGVITIENARLAAWNITGEMVRENMSAAMNNDLKNLPSFEEIGDKLGATLAELSENSKIFLKKLGYAYNGTNYTIEENSAKDEDIAVFCHAGFGLSWIADLIAMPTALVWTGLWLATSSVTTILFDERVKGFATPRCLCVGDISHLHAAGLPRSNAGLVSKE